MGSVSLEALEVVELDVREFDVMGPDVVSPQEKRVNMQIGRTSHHFFFITLAYKV